MATKKSKTKGRATTAHAKPSARAGRAKSAKRVAKPKISAKPAAKPKAVAKPKVAAKPVPKTKPAAAKRPAPARAAAPKRPAAKPAAAVENAEVAALKSKFQRERNTLEKRLTEAVREIGLLRHHELRAMQLERQLAERDATIVSLQGRLADLDRRPAESVVYVQEVQQTLALGMPSREDAVEAAGIDAFEEPQLVDDGELMDDDFDDGDLVSDD